MTSLKELKEQERKDYSLRIVEALLFSSCDPLSIQKIQETIRDFHPFSQEEIKEFLQQLQKNYQRMGHSFGLDEVANGYILRTHASFAPYIEKLRGHKRVEKLSQASVETLAIIAHKQPIARSQIEAIRGVDSSGTLQSLLEKELIHIVGKMDAPGRPSLYSVTEKFMHYFGIRSLQEITFSTQE